MVADGRRHGSTLVAVDGVHHELECRINDYARLLGVEPFHYLRRALDVGERSGDRFPLPVLSPATPRV
jgi:hypothetical protein